MHFAKPRVAAIGLDETQVDSIRPLCGELWTSPSWTRYLKKYSALETDIAVVARPTGTWSGAPKHMLLIRPGALNIPYRRSGSRASDSPIQFVSDISNTERDVWVADACPELYAAPAAELVQALRQRDEAAPAVYCSLSPDDAVIPLILTTSHRAIALRGTVRWVPETVDDDGSEGIVVALPDATGLVAWFRVFLLDVREHDPDCVPMPPPTFARPSDWYTPEQRRLAQRIAELDASVERLLEDRKSLEEQMAEEDEEAEGGIRRALSADGDDLVAAVERILADLGFTARNMDSEIEPGEPKREDLRLTLPGRSGWEAIVEVKGYTSGTKTNDARQIRAHRDRYQREEGRLPDQTIWIANPYRSTDPSTRTAPDANVDEAAAIAGAVYALTTDLYLLWVADAENHPDCSSAVQELIEAEPGLWRLPRELASDQ